MKIASMCVACGSLDLLRNSAVLMPFVSDRVFGWKPFVITGLRDIPGGTAYALCNTLRCQRCGLMFCDMRFSDDEMKRLYRDYRGMEYTELREIYEPGYAARNEELMQENHVAMVEEYLSPLKPYSVLDFGGDDGTKTPFADRAMVCDVYDIGEREVVRGRKVLSFGRQYDLVVCAHVLEHVSYPRLILKNIQKVMHAKSVLYIELPLEEMGEKQHWHEHINFFTKAALYALLEQCGMEASRYEEANLNGMKIQRLIARSIL